MYTTDGKVYGYVSGNPHGNYLYDSSGKVIGYFKPPLGASSD
jgi:hypothetical protein